MAPGTTFSTSRTSSAKSEFQLPRVWQRKLDPEARTKDNVYVFGETARLAVQVALATGRPLLVRGAPGWGKSSLARAAASHLGWNLYSDVISSRTQARDLLWTTDLVQRLNDAQAQKLDPDWAAYIVPGVLWKAFDPATARTQEHRYARGATSTNKPAPTPRAVVLLDEIDKADPDVPNNLLVPLGELEFDVPQLDIKVKADPNNAPLVIITTNEERDLPAAFLRRCVELRLPTVNGDDADGEQRRQLLVEIGVKHLEEDVPSATVEKIINKLLGKKTADGVVDLPSPAELLDTLRAVLTIYGRSPAAEALDNIAAITMWKHGRKRPVTS